MFMRMLGARQTMERAIETAPAARRQKSTNAKHPISFLETIVDATKCVLASGEYRLD